MRCCLLCIFSFSADVRKHATGEMNKSVSRRHLLSRPSLFLLRSTYRIGGLHFDIKLPKARIPSSSHAHSLSPHHATGRFARCHRRRPLLHLPRRPVPPLLPPRRPRRLPPALMDWSASKNPLRRGPATTPSPSAAVTLSLYPPPTPSTTPPLSAPGLGGAGSLASSLTSTTRSCTAL